MMGSVVTGLLRNIPRAALLPLRLWQRARACPTGAWVHLVIDGEVTELRHPRPPLPWARKPAAGLGLDRLHLLVDELLQDPSPAGLLVTIRSMSASAAMRTALRSELQRLRKAGRAVVVHLPVGGGSGELLVASAASRILLGAQTTLGPLGFQAGSFYLRRALERAGLEADIHAQGDFKTAGETLAREVMSGPQREQLQRLLDVFFDELAGALSEGRRVSREVAAGWLDRGLLSSEDALREGLVDAVVHDDEVRKMLGDSVRTDDAEVVGAGAYLWRRRQQLFAPLRPGKIIAVIEAHGPIVDRAPGPGGRFCDAERVVKLLDDAAEAAHVAGVVLHIDTPGGGVLASEKIHRAVSRLADKKPVVACFGGVAASGGYYVASGCHAIVARETSVTGSIGVVAARMLTAPLLDKLGIRPEVLVRGAHADMLRSSRPFDEDERSIFRSELERAYRRFLSLVADGRRRKVDEIEPLAGGRVWSGSDAHARGLVDRIGGLDEALDEVRSRAKLGPDEAHPMLWRPRAPVTLSTLIEMLPGVASLRASVEASVGPWAAPLTDVARALLASREPVLALSWLWPPPG